MNIKENDSLIMAAVNILQINEHLEEKVDALSI